MIDINVKIDTHTAPWGYVSNSYWTTDDDTYEANCAGKVFFVLWQDDDPSSYGWNWQVQSAGYGVKCDPYAGNIVKIGYQRDLSAAKLAAEAALLRIIADDLVYRASLAAKAAR